MSDDRHTAAVFDPVVKPFIDFWSDCVKQTNDVTRELLDGIDENSNVTSWQRKWSETVSKSMDAYMRSPVFLQAMKQNADAAIKAKRQADDLASEFARNANIPTTGDISGLFERLHSIEEVILGRLNGIDQRLQAIEAQIG